MFSKPKSEPRGFFRLYVFVQQPSIVPTTQRIVPGPDAITYLPLEECSVTNDTLFSILYLEKKDLLYYVSEEKVISKLKIEYELNNSRIVVPTRPLFINRITFNKKILSQENSVFFKNRNGISLDSETLKHVQNLGIEVIQEEENSDKESKENDLEDEDF